MNKHLLSFLVAGTVLTTHSASAQAHQGVPVPHTPVHEVKHVPQPILNAYEDYIAGNPFVTATGEPKWTRQNGLLEAHVPATDFQERSGVALFRFKPKGGLVLFEFVADEETGNEP